MDTVFTITDKVVEEMTAWANRPLDAGYPVISIDAIVVKVRDGQVRNKPIYVVIGVTVTGNATSSACGPAVAQRLERVRAVPRLRDLEIRKIIWPQTWLG